MHRSRLIASTSVYLPQPREERLLRLLLPCRLDSLCEGVLSLDSALEPLASVRFGCADSLKALRLLLLRNEDPCSRILEFRLPVFVPRGVIKQGVRGSEPIATLLRGCVSQLHLPLNKLIPGKIYSTISPLASCQESAAEVALHCCLKLLVSRHTKIHVRVLWGLLAVRHYERDHRLLVALRLSSRVQATTNKC